MHSVEIQDPWVFPEASTIVIVCSSMPADERSPYADSCNPNFMKTARYSDMDSVICVYGHLREHNVTADIKIVGALDLNSADLSSHLILIGGPTWNVATALALRELDLPFDFVYDEDEVFVLDGAEYTPDVKPGVNGIDGDDYSIFVHSRNPFSVDHRLSMCFGLLALGTLGTVSLLTDPAVREQNLLRLAPYLAPDMETTLMLFLRHRIADSSVESPNLQDPATLIRAYELTADRNEAPSMLDSVINP